MESCEGCAKIVALEERVKTMKEDIEQHSKDIRTLLDFMAGVKMLMSLSIGGGALSLINLLIVIAQYLTK